ncbi:MAG: S41 family peptidase [Planctomycetota bacterium]
MYELDPFSEIIWPHRFPRFTQTTRGNFIGVGIVIRHDEAHEILVVNPLEGTPAYFAGVKPSDRIAEVDGVSTVGWSLNDAVDKITGRKGTEVTLGMKREGVEDLIQLTIVRDVIKIHTVRGWWKQGLDDDGDPVWDWYIDPISRIAYVRLTQFTEDTFTDLEKAWRQAKEAGQPNGLILDLRYNPGGLLSSAVQISNLFVERGVIVSGEDKNGRRAWPDQRARHELALIADDGIPTVILVNKGSASASEIVAGCLQAHGAAVVIGERTFGKGSVQTVHQVTNKAMLKLTTQYYRLPSPDGGETPGRLVHKRPGADVWGVDPDIVVTMTPAQIVASLELRQKADLIPEDDDGNPDPDSPERPNINELLAGGLDPQLEAALLLLQATALGNETDARHAMLN